jgi:hypothetical protein
MMRVKSEIPVGAHNSLKYSIDNGEMKGAHLHSGTSWTWSTAANNDKQLMRMKTLKLGKGKHTIKVMPREPLYLDMIAITKTPKIFEPR